MVCCCCKGAKWNQETYGKKLQGYLSLSQISFFSKSRNPEIMRSRDHEKFLTNYNKNLVKINFYA